MYHFYDCINGVRGNFKFDLSFSSYTPGEKLVAENLNFLGSHNNNIYFFKEFNVFRGRRIDFLIYNKNNFFVILEVKDWDKNYIEEINFLGEQRLSEFFKLKFSLKTKNLSVKNNPYESQCKRYLNDFNNYFKTLKNLNSKYNEVNIPTCSFVVFPNLSKEDFEKLLNKEIKENIKNMIFTHTIFKEDINKLGNLTELYSLVLNQIKTYDNLDNFNEIGIFRNIKIRDSENIINDLITYNLNNNYMVLDQNQQGIAESIENLKNKFLFIYGVAGSGKTYIMEYRLEEFLRENINRNFSNVFNKNEDYSMYNNKKILIFLKDKQSTLYNYLHSKYDLYGDNIFLLDLLTKDRYIQANDKGVEIKVSTSTKPYYKTETILYEDIKEIYIDEVNDIVSHSSKSFAELKNLISCLNLYGQDINTILLTDANQINYNGYYFNNFGENNIKNIFWKVLGIEDSNKVIEFDLNISYRLDYWLADFTFRYLLYYTSKFSKKYIDYFEQLYSIKNNILMDRDTYCLVTEKELYNSLENSLCYPYYYKENDLEIDLRYNKNLIYFNFRPINSKGYENLKEKNLHNSLFIENYETLSKISVRDFSFTKNTITHKVDFIKGREFDNLIFITKFEDFFLNEETLNYENIYENYLVMTRAINNLKILIVVNERDKNMISSKIDNLISKINNFPKDLLCFYRNK